MENDSTADENISLTTSTPKKMQFECGECKNESQYTDCFVHFSDEI